MKTINKSIIAKLAAALMVVLLAVSGMSMNVYAAGLNITIANDGVVSPDTYAQSRYAGIDGMRSTAIGENEIDSIKTADGGTDDTTYGVAYFGSSTLSIGSLAGGIKIAVGSNCDGYGVHNAGSGTIMISNLGGISVKAQNEAAYGVYNGTIGGTVTIANCPDNMAIEATAMDAANAYAIYNYGIINLGETGKTVNLGGNVKNNSGATLTLAGTTNVTGYVVNDGTLNLIGTTNVTGAVTNNGTLNLNGQMTVSDNFGGAGLIVVDMSFVGTDSKPEEVVLVDCEGTAVYAAYNLPTGMDNGYVLEVVGNDLVAKLDTRTLTFDVQGHGTAPDAQTVEKGTKATEPAAPEADGYTFGGWYREATCETAWDFDSDTVTDDTTVYAKWTEVETEAADVPSTGDTTNMWLYIALAALALGAMGAAVVMRRKANR